MKILFTILLLWHCSQGVSQQTLQDEDELNASQLEDLSESEGSESEDDYAMQQLSVFKKHPVSLNASSEILGEFPLLDPLLISNLINYRRFLGNLVNIHELQAVPGFTIELIKRIIPYVIISDEDINLKSIRERLRRGEHIILFRPAITPESVKGFLRSNQGTTQIFTGSRPALFARYKYQYGNLLQYGIVADKDAGEKLFTGKGIAPDYYSFHLFTRRLGCIRALAIGDYTLNLGQGLIFWQSQAFKKSSGVVNIKRQSETLRPYHSAGEYNFQRGVAVTISNEKWEGTLFGSYRKLSANIDTDEIYGKVITSIQTSGLHRTRPELDDKNKISLILTGGSIKMNCIPGHARLNAVRYHYSLPIIKSDEPYNLYAIKGKSWSDYSFDYSYTFRNYHFFGEAAVDQGGGLAFINGLVASLDASLDIAVLHRKINKAYQSVYGSAFTENTLPSNENGFYTGLTCKPFEKWKIDLYADIFSFPWIKYRLNAPSNGFQYLIQLTWKPNKQFELYSRLRYRMKPLNIEDEDGTIFPDQQVIQNWRTQAGFQVTRDILLRSRTEISVFNYLGQPAPARGYLYYIDLVFKPLGRRFSGNIRFQTFETQGYDTRIYAYENDLLYATATPAFFNCGVRYYLNIKAKFRIKALGSKELLMSFKAASTVYKNQTSIGSGSSAIDGNRKSDLKLQILFFPAS